jgi:hypothetical protein
VGDTLWVRTYLGLPAVFETATGRSVRPAAEMVKLQKKQAWSFGVRMATAGRDIVVVEDDLVLQGGQPLLSNPDMRSDKTAARFIACAVRPDGQAAIEPLPSTAIPSSMVAPALDGTDILIVGAGASRTWRSRDPTIGLGLWDVQTWKNEYGGAINPEDLRQGYSLGLSPETARWHLPGLDVSAVVLTSRSAVAAIGERRPAERGNEHAGYAAWTLTALDRATGATQWSVKLPGEPVNGGIAPAADGAFVVALRDGSLACVGP